MLPGIIDEMIDILLSGKLSKRLSIPEADIFMLLESARTVLLSECSLLEVKAPINVIGDIHGQYSDLRRYFDTNGHPPANKYLLLGDYVDRGKHSIEVLTLLLCYKVKYPDKVFLLRGNHESESINHFYGFYDECKRRATAKLWKNFVSTYNCLPLAAVINNKIFCCHGGLSPDLHELTDIRQIERPREVPEQGLMCDLLWSDPAPGIFGWAKNDRGVSYVFGANIVYNFLKRFKMDLVCRAHQVAEDGYEFFAKRQLITLFSAANYCGEYDNAGAMMCISEDLTVAFVVIKPVKTIKFKTVPIEEKSD